MIRVCDKWYDSLRRLFIPVASSPETICKVQAMYPVVDNLVKRKQDVFSVRWDQAPIDSFRIEKAGICTSRNCPLRCLYCSECSSEGFPPGIKNEDILSFVEDLMQKWMVRHMLTGRTDPLPIMFSGGGEPTFDFPAFQALVEALESLALRNEVPISMNITTNGAYEIEITDFLCDHFQSIMVSYDGLPDIQNRNRPSPHFKETSPIVVRNIRHILNRNIPLIVRTTVWPTEVSRLPDMAEFLYSSVGTKFKWSIFPVTPKGRAMGKTGPGQGDEDDFCSVFLELIDNTKRKYGPVSISSPLFFSSPVEQYCGSLAFLTRVAWLRHDGRIATCLEMGKDETVIGHVRNGTIVWKEIVRDPLTRIAQDRQALCEDCIAFPFCGGGCPADHHANGDNGLKSRSWACRQTIRFWEHIMRRALAGEECFGWNTIPSRFEQFKNLGVLEFLNTEERNETRRNSGQACPP